MKSVTDEDGFIQIIISPGAFEIEALNREIRSINSDEGRFTEANYPFTIKPNFSTLGSLIEISPQGPIISFMFDDSLGDFLAFNARTFFEEYNLSSNPVEIPSFDSIFRECNIAQRMTSRVKDPEKFIFLLWMLILVINTLENVEVECSGI